jgi:hypothetical protein
VQTFYQPLFSHSFPFSNFPLAILFPSVILFLSKRFPHQKAQRQRQEPLIPKQKPQTKAQSEKPKPKAKPRSKSQRQKNLMSSFSRSFINSCKQGGALREGRDIVTGETCVPASQNTNNLGDTAVLLFPVRGWGCAYLGLQIKALKLHLILLCSVLVSFFFIIRSPHYF